MAGFLVVVGRTGDWGTGDRDGEQGLMLCLIRNPTLLPWSLSIPYLIFLGNLQWSNLEGLP